MSQYNFVKVRVILKLLFSEIMSQEYARSRFKDRQLRHSSIVRRTWRQAGRQTGRKADRQSKKRKTCIHPETGSEKDKIDGWIDRLIGRRTAHIKSYLQVLYLRSFKL